MSRNLPVIETCDGCGACCLTVSAPPFQIDYVRNELTEKQVPPELQKTLLPAWEVRLHVTDGPCLWYDEQTQRCGHYDLRPDTCRAFEINSPSCRAVREEYGIDSQ